MIDRHDVIELVRQLPTIPQALIDLQKLLMQPNVSVDQVDRVIRTDPALTANILRLANSAAFGLSRKVADIPQAVTLVGFKVLNNLANTAAFSKTIPADFPGYRLSAAQFLRHGFAVGVLSESLAAKISAPANRPYFTAGLLHDIGKLVLGTFVAVHHQELCKRLDSEELTFVDVERQVLGVDHGQVAAWIGERWQLPRELIAAAEMHHRPDEVAGDVQPIVDIVHVADMSAHCLGFGADLGELARSIHRGPFERLNLNADILEKVASGSVERLVQELPTDLKSNSKLKIARKLGILVVDDSSIIRQMVCKSLSLAGLPPHEVIEAKDGAEALARMNEKSTKFDLVLADIHMPNMTGTQLVQAMYQDQRLKRIPVIIISSDGNAANQELLRSLGVRALLRKPFRPEHLRAVVNPILSEQARLA
jgi:putative nucleotidyltransferase with HDIG domain